MQCINRSIMVRAIRASQRVSTTTDQLFFPT